LLVALLLAADGAATGADTAAPAPRADTAPAACAGDDLDLDLDRIIAEKSCDVSGETRPPPAKSAIAIELSPKKLTLAAGETAPVTVTFRNRTDAPLPLDLDMTCEMEIAFATEIYKGRKRADLPQDCGIGDACGRHLVRVTLAPRGIARVHVSISATAEVLQQCVPTGRRKPLAAGKYRLVVNTPLDDRPSDSNQMQLRQVVGELTVSGRQQSFPPALQGPVARLPGP
jgi:hypothetical protein